MAYVCISAPAAVPAGGHPYPRFYGKCASTAELDAVRYRPADPRLLTRCCPGGLERGSKSTWRPMGQWERLLTLQPQDSKAEKMPTA